jgi:hypothetical protein
LALLQLGLGIPQSSARLLFADFLETGQLCATANATHGDDMSDNLHVPHRNVHKSL